MTSDQQEARDERKAICQTEGVSADDIHTIFDTYPEIYGENE